MCLGNNQQTNQTTQTTTPPAWLSGAAQSNIDFAQGLQSKGFTPYTGQMVAGFSPQQQQSFGLGTDIASTVNPTLPTAGAALQNYTTAPGPSVNANPIYSNMSPYMNQYVQQALAPQLQMQDQQFAAQNKGWDASAE